MYPLKEVHTLSINNIFFFIKIYYNLYVCETVFDASCQIKCNMYLYLITLIKYD